MKNGDYIKKVKRNSKNNKVSRKIWKTRICSKRATGNSKASWKTLNGNEKKINRISKNFLKIIKNRVILENKSLL